MKSFYKSDYKEKLKKYVFQKQAKNLHYTHFFYKELVFLQYDTS